MGWDGWQYPIVVNLVEKHTTFYTGGKRLLGHEWRGQLRDEEGGTQWRIKYYGGLKSIGGLLRKRYQMIVGGEEGPVVVIAEHPVTGEEILLFDGDRHGYDGMFVDYSDVTGERTPVSIYRDRDGEELFSVIISVYNPNYREDAELDLDDDGMATLRDGTRVDAETARRDSYDFLQIIVTNAAGRSTSIVEEELA